MFLLNELLRKLYVNMIDYDLVRVWLKLLFLIILMVGKNCVNRNRLNIERYVLCVLFYLWKVMN